MLRSGNNEDSQLVDTIDSCFQKLSPMQEIPIRIPKQTTGNSFQPSMSKFSSMEAFEDWFKKQNFCKDSTNQPSFVQPFLTMIELEKQKIADEKKSPKDCLNFLEGQLRGIYDQYENEYMNAHTNLIQHHATKKKCSLFVITFGAWNESWAKLNLSNKKNPSQAVEKSTCYQPYPLYARQLAEMGEDVVIINIDRGFQSAHFQPNPRVDIFNIAGDFKNATPIGDFLTVQIAANPNANLILHSYHVGNETPLSISWAEKLFHNSHCKKRVEVLSGYFDDYPFNTRLQIEKCDSTTGKYSENTYKNFLMSPPSDCAGKLNVIGAEFDSVKELFAKALLKETGHELLPPHNSLTIDKLPKLGERIEKDLETKAARKKK